MFKDYLFIYLFKFDLKSYILTPFSSFSPAGHFCPNNTQFATENPCNNGTYNNRTGGHSVDDCELCPPGMYCPYRGMEDPAAECAEGWYCTLGAWKDKPTSLGNDTGKNIMGWDLSRVILAIKVRPYSRGMYCTHWVMILVIIYGL